MRRRTRRSGLNRKGIEYTVLQREAESNRQVYESLLQRTKETGISGELKSSNIRVVDPAEVPTNPVLPRRSNDLMMALLAGSVLALGLVFLFEYLDNRIKSPQELRALNLAFLGMVPKIDNSGPTLLNDVVPPAFGEAIRAVRTNVLFSSADEGVRTVVVTSAGPGEGKSLFSSNLSVSLAQAGQRVLHIDADMRRPRVHDIFDVSQEPGFSNLLVGDCKPSEAVRKTGICESLRAARRHDSAESGGAARVEALRRVSRHAGGALRLGRDRFAASARRRGRIGAGQCGLRRHLRHRCRSDDAEHRQGGRRSVERGAGARDRRRAEPRGRPAQPVLLLGVLPQGVQPLLRQGAVAHLIDPRGRSSGQSPGQH